MRPRRIVIAAIAAAAALGIGAIAIASQSSDGGSIARALGLGGGSSAAPSTHPGARPPVPSATLVPVPKGGAGLDGGPGVLIPTATPTPYRLADAGTGASSAPTQDPSAQLASFTGTLLAHFPSSPLVAPGSKLASSSLSSQHKTTQLALSATSTATPAATLDYYRTLLASVGVSGRSVPAVGGSASLGFALGGSSMTVTVSPHGSGGSSYSLYGVLRPGS